MGQKFRKYLIGLSLIYVTSTRGITYSEGDFFAHRPPSQCPLAIFCTWCLTFWDFPHDLGFSPHYGLRITYFFSSFMAIIFQQAGRYSKLNILRDSGGSMKTPMAYSWESCSNHIFSEWASATVQIREERATPSCGQGAVWFSEGVSHLSRRTIPVLFTPGGTLRIMWRLWKEGSKKMDNDSY